MLKQEKIKVVLLEGASLPKYSCEGDAGMDLCAFESAVLHPKTFLTIRTGIKIELPEGLEAQIRPRSGLAAKRGITVLNSPGTVDSGYRGEIKVVLINHSESDFQIEIGDRIAQMVIAEYVTAQWAVVDEINDSLRGSHGFGSSGRE